jgi:tetratricopeptide (TPR) repeat protein
MERSIELTRQLGDRHSEAAQLVQLGNLYMYDDELEQARRLYADAEPHLDHDPQNFMWAAVAANLGMIALDLGEYDEALTNFRLAGTRTATGNFDLDIFLRSGIGHALHGQRYHDQAIAEFTSVLEIAQRNKLPRGQALAQAGLAQVQRSIGNFDEALASGREALTLARELDLRPTECEALNAIGEIAFAMGDCDRAEEVFEQSLDRARSYEIPRYESRALEGFAHVSMARHRLSDAQRYWEESISVSPAGLLGVSYARLHLRSLGDEASVCFRCETAAVIHSKAAMNS